MINYDSILSAFDGKPTLLQWLKMVKKALDESILKNVNITQNGQKVVFTFNFEDGTSISTPEVTLPKGDKGDTGVGIVSVNYDHTDIIGDNTETYFKVTLSNGVENTFAVFAKNGKDGSNGNDGVSITGINTAGSEVVGDETLTTLRANYSNNTTDEFVIKAKNGKDSSGTGGNIYLHHVRISNPAYNSGISFEVYSSKETLTLEDALNYVPTSENSDISGASINKIPVYFDSGNGSFGFASSSKYLSGSNYSIIVHGIVYNAGTNSIKNYNDSFQAVSIRDTLLGVNL